MKNNKGTLINWNHLIILGMGNSTLSTTLRDADIYVSLFNGRLPTAEDSDLTAETNGPDYLNISSDDPYFLSRPLLLKQGPSQILIIIGIRGKASNTSFTLLNWAPYLSKQSEAFFSFTDLNSSKPSSSIQF